MKKRPKHKYVDATVICFEDFEIYIESLNLLVQEVLVREKGVPIAHAIYEMQTEEEVINNFLDTLESIREEE